MAGGGIPEINLKNFPMEHQKLIEACQEWGCFRAVNHGISLKLMAEIKLIARLLNRPPEIEQEKIDYIKGSGYLAPTEANPLYESWRVHDAASLEAVDTFCTQFNISPEQREIVQIYARATHELAMDISQELAKGLGLVGDFFQGWPSQFRINKYNFTPDTIGASGVQIHADLGFLTVLQDDEIVGGLEVMDKSGKFVAIDPWPGTLLVNLGDVARAWSNGRFRSMQHRVQCKEPSVRVSMALFLLGPMGEALESPDELVDSDHPRLFLPFSFEELVKLRHSSGFHNGEALELLRRIS